MNSDHPEQTELLFYLDGELESTAADSIRQHLDSCWTCRMRASSLQDTILAYTRERERSAVPEPPSPWKDLSADFQRLQGSNRPSFLHRIRTGAIFRTGRVALFCGAVTALGALAWFTLPHNPKAAPAKLPEPTVHAPVPAFSPPPIRKSKPLKRLHKEPTTDPYAAMHEEVAIVAALHALKADLGEPVELKRNSEGHFILNTLDLGPDRMGEIRRALAAFQHLAIQVAEPKANAGPRGTAPNKLTVSRPIAFENDLEQYAGGRQTLLNLADDILDASDRIVMYAHAIENLDKRFPLAAQQPMNVDDHKSLARIQADYRSGALQAAASLRSLMDPIFTTVDVAAASQPPEDLLETALHVDRLLNAAFAGSQSSLSDRDLYGNLRGWYAQLMEQLQ